MADTHINAFFGAVDEAEAKVVAAQSELDAAEARLETKKQEVGYVEAEPEVAPEAEKPAKAKVDVKQNKK